jgi:hypothetical protein
LDFEQEAQNIFRVRKYFDNVKNTPLVIPNGAIVTLAGLRKERH